MPRFFVKTDQIQDETITILGEDVKHIKNVLRKDKGEKIEICNQENGKTYNCEINNIEDNSIITKIIDQIEEQEDKIKIDIYQGLPKADKMELIIQKSVELGVNQIIPVEMKRCVVKLKEKDANKKIERWQKISESAAKQCGRNTIPKVQNICKIKDICDRINEYAVILVAYENEKQNKLKEELIKLKNRTEIKIAIVIGPEGGLEEKDVQSLKDVGAKIITLGNRILRTETVSLNCLSIIMYELEE